MSGAVATSGPTHLETEAHLVCEQLFLAFHGHIDDGHATRSLDLLTEDAVFEVRGTRHEGREAIGRFLRAREEDVTRRTRHLASNFRFVRDSERAAHASANLTLFTGVGEDGRRLALEAVIDCELAFVRGDDGEWRIGRRRHTRFATAP